MERVVVYEPRRLVREGLSGYLERAAFAVDAYAGLEEMVQALKGPGDFAVVSFDGGALETTAALGRVGACLRNYRVLAIASVLDQLTARRLRAFGVTDVASPEIGLAGVVSMLRAPASPGRVLRLDPDAHCADAPRLTPREREVIVLVSSGLTASQIASQLRISTKTVENHKQRVFRKLDVQSQSHAVSVALRLGLLGPACSSALAAGS
jgi:DNA-binding NarL/FixJ family response regulator